MWSNTRDLTTNHFCAGFSSHVWIAHGIETRRQYDPEKKTGQRRWENHTKIIKNIWLWIMMINDDWGWDERWWWWWCWWWWTWWTWWWLMTDVEDISYTHTLIHVLRWGGLRQLALERQSKSQSQWNLVGWNMLAIRLCCLRFLKDKIQQMHFGTAIVTVGDWSPRQSWCAAHYDMCLFLLFDCNMHSFQVD